MCSFHHRHCRTGLYRERVRNVLSLANIVVRAVTFPYNFIHEIIFAENLVEHDFDVVAGVPVAVVIKAAGPF